MGENNKKPSIRFAEFNDAWEQRKLNELGKIETGNTPSTSISKYYCEEGLPWITPTDIISNLTTKTERTLSAEGAKVARVIPANSVLCTCIASIGKNTFSPVKCAFNQQINALIPNNNQDPYFMYTDSYHWSETMKKGAGGLTFQIVNKTEFSNILTNVPCKKEQIKIGELFKNIDNLITLHQRKCDQLSNVKKALLEKMFPSEGEYAPRIRFKSFTDAWEQRKLGDIGKTFTGLSGKTATDFGHGQAKFLPYLNIFNNPIADISFLESIEIDKSQNQICYGDVFFTTSSETPEEVGMSSIWLGKSKNIYLNSFCFGFRPTIEFNPYYFGYLLRSDTFRKPITILAQGISRFNISKTKVMEIKIPLPSKDEQSKIGELFKNLDNLITLHQRKCEKLKNLKKSLLEKMFI